MIKEFIKNQSAKAKLRRCFKSAGLIDKHKSGDKEVIVYPKIHDVKFDEELKATRYVFTLVNGMDPKEISKKEFVFMQHFGKNIELEGDYKKFELKVYQNGLVKELLYRYDDIETAIKELKVPIVCGKDRNGKWKVYDAVTAPNCLISGEPGAGKSTQCRSIISTLIQYKSPEELHIYLGDLKMSEFFLFKDVEHVKSVCVYPDDMAKMLKHLHKELKHRGELLNKHRVDHIMKVPGKHPFILLAIDEIVMIMDDREMKKELVQIASLGRALGIFCMLSLQRPSHDILDTKIRSLLTVRMGFRTVDASNSKLIGTPGSEKISEDTPGRFLMKRSDITELQAPYITLEKAEKLLEPYRVDGWKDMFAKTAYQPPEEPKKEDKELSEDDLFSEVLKGE
jgi:DNA segregation ATPase FtsK/SpoIIIE, S-DNA-T family